MEKYIGNKKILAVVEIAKETEVTPAQNEMVSVSFEDGTNEVMPKLRYELIVTDTVSSASGIQETLNKKVGAGVYSMLHEYGIKFGEIDGIMDNCVNLANSGFHKAQDILFKCSQSDIPLNEINKILLKDYAEQNNNGVASTGSGVDSENKKSV